MKNYQIYFRTCSEIDDVPNELHETVLTHCGSCAQRGEILLADSAGAKANA